jgi:peptidylamidoglycolate lyase
MRESSRTALDRANTLRRWSGASALALAASLVLACVQRSRAPAQPQRDASSASSMSRAESPYAVVHGWPVLPDGEVFGVVAGIGADSRGDVLVFHRNERSWPASDVLDTTPIRKATVLRFDGATGALKQQWGAGQFAMPHGLTIDRDDNVWVTDVALHQVYKFSHDGARLLLVKGERGVAGADSAHFNRPTKVAIRSDGDFYVSDGYGNSRVIQFRSDGSFVREWGRKGSGRGQFDVPHAVALDSRGRVYVADRENSRVQIFDSTGHYLTAWTGPEYGRAFDVAVGRGDTVFIADGGGIPDPPDRSAVIVVAPDGAVLGRFGRFGYYDGEFYRAHYLTVAPDGAVYVGDAGARAQKFIAGREPH